MAWYMPGTIEHDFISALMNQSQKVDASRKAVIQATVIITFITVYVRRAS